MIHITQASVLQALSRVQEPDLHKDLVTLKMIRNLELTENSIAFTILLTTPACPLKDKMLQDCKDALHADFGQDISIQIQFDAQVNTARTDKIVLPGVKNIVAVASGKGGVGKSTVSSNLAVQLANMGAKVGLIDADIYGPSVPTMFGVHEAPGMRTIEGKDVMVPIEKFGIKLLSIGFLIQPGQAVAWRGPMVSSALRQFVNDTDWGELDYLIIDLPPGTGDIQLTLSQIVPINGIVLVTTPQKVALADAEKAIAMFQMAGLGDKITGIVENMAYFVPEELPDHTYYLFGKDGGKNMALQFGIPFLAEIPIYMSIREGGDAGTPAAMHENSPVSHAFRTLTENMARRIAVANSKNVSQEV